MQTEIIEIIALWLSLMAFAVLAAVSSVRLGSTKKANYEVKSCPISGEPAPKGTIVALIKNPRRGKKYAIWAVAANVTEAHTTLKGSKKAGYTEVQTGTADSGTSAPPSPPKPPSSPISGSSTEGWGFMAGQIAPHILAGVEAEIEARLASLRLPRETVLKPLGKLPKVELGMVHQAFDRLHSLMRVRRPCLIVGPAGSGKTFAVEQVHDALLETGEIATKIGQRENRGFVLTSCNSEMLPSDIVGAMIPSIGGDKGAMTYVRHSGIDCYEYGGTWIFDEADRLTAGTAVVVNAALAGNFWPLPDGSTAKRHPDFNVIWTANTFGTGRDALYSASERLDAATLNRFAGGVIRFEYDSNLETHLCPTETIREGLQEIRDLMNASHIRRIISPRHLMAAHSDHVVLGLSEKDAINSALTDWSEGDLINIGFSTSRIERIQVLAQGGA